MVIIAALALALVATAHAQPANNALYLRVKSALGQLDSVMMDPATKLDDNARWEKTWKALFLSK